MPEISIYSGIKTNYKNLYDSLFETNLRILYFIVSKRPDKETDDYYLFEDFGSYTEDNCDYETLDIIDKYYDEDDFTNYDVDLVKKVLVKFEEFAEKKSSFWIEYIYVLYDVVREINSRHGTCTEIDIKIIDEHEEELNKYIEEHGMKGASVVFYAK